MSAPQAEGGGAPRLGGRRLGIVALAAAVLLSGAMVLIGEILTGGEPDRVRDCVIQGRTLVGPLQPVAHPGDSNRAAVMATVSVADYQTGRAVAAARSDAGGRFRIRVAAGDYVVTAWLQSATPSARPPVPMRVTAAPGKPVKLVLLFDTGVHAVGSPAP